MRIIIRLIIFIIVLTLEEVRVAEIQAQAVIYRLVIQITISMVKLWNLEIIF